MMKPKRKNCRIRDICRICGEEGMCTGFSANYVIGTCEKFSWTPICDKCLHTPADNEWYAEKELISREECLKNCHRCRTYMEQAKAEADRAAASAGKAECAARQKIGLYVQSQCPHCGYHDLLRPNEAALCRSCGGHFTPKGETK